MRRWTDELIEREKAVRKLHESLRRELELYRDRLNRSLRRRLNGKSLKQKEAGKGPTP